MAADEGSGEARVTRVSSAFTSSPPRSTATVIPGARDDEPIAFGVQRSELSRTIALFGLLFLGALIFVVGRTAREALFLTQYPVSLIGPMWMIYAVVSSFVALGYARVVDRLPRAKFGVGFALLAAASYAALRLAMGEELRIAYAIFYVWSDVISNLTVVVAWTIAHDYHDARSAKRLYGIIGAGYVTGTVLSGFGAGAVVKIIGAANLIVVLVIALLAVAWLVAFVVRRHATPLAATPVERDGVKAGPVLRSSYVAAISAFTLVLFAVLTMGDYQFKAIARTAFPARDDLGRFIANFYGVVGAVGLVIQLFFTPRILRRFGVLAGTVVLPIAFLASTLGLLAAPGLVLATILKSADAGLQYTIHEATMQLLYFPFPAATRGRVRTAITAVMKPVGCGVGAIGLLFFAPSAGASTPGPALIHTAAHLGVYTAPLLLLALAIAPLVRRGYVASMRRTLLRREVEPDELVPGPTARRVLSEALASEDAPQVIFAAEQLRSVDRDRLRDALPALAKHTSPRVRALALRLSVDLGAPSGGDLAREALGDDDDGVRVAAVETLAIELREDAHDELVTLLDGDDVPLQSAAIAALVRHGGLDGILDGAPRLRALLDATEPERRVEAARVLGMIGGGQLQRSLAKLLVDDDARVRRAAVEAASKVGDPQLLPLLLEALEERSLTALAAGAIAALGDVAVTPTLTRLADEGTSLAVRLALPRVLFRIGTRSALDALVGRIAEHDELVRQKVLASASRLRLALQAPPIPFSEAATRIEAELAEHVRVRDEYLAVRPRVARPLEDEHVVLRLRKSIIRVLRLCELVYPRDLVAAARVHLFGSDATLRANAVEVLESLLDRRLREKLVAVVEQLHRLRARDFGKPRSMPSDAAVRAFIRKELAQPDAYRAALALDAVAYRRLHCAGPDALALLHHEHPLVRETAAIAVAMTKPDGAAHALEELVGDEDDAVRAFAEHWTRTGDAGIDESDDDLMYTTIEKVLFLQHIPVFSKVNGQDLAALARGSVVVTSARGDTLFREGDPGGSLFFVISGGVRLTVKGREVASLAANDVFGELSIFDREPRQITAHVVEDTELLRVSSESFREAVRESAEIAEAVIQVLGRRLHEADRRIVALGGRGDREATPRKDAHRTDDEELE